MIKISPIYESEMREHKHFDAYNNNALYKSTAETSVDNLLE